MSSFLTPGKRVSSFSEYLSISQAARELGLSEAQVRRYVRDGKIRSVDTTLGALLDPQSVRAMSEERERSKRFSDG